MIEFEQTGERVDFFSFEKMFHGHQTAPNLDYFFCFKIIPLLKCCKFSISIIFSFKNNIVHKENTPTKQHCEKLQLKYKSGGMFVVFPANVPSFCSYVPDVTCFASVHHTNVDRAYHTNQSLLLKYRTYVCTKNSVLNIPNSINIKRLQYLAFYLITYLFIWEFSNSCGNFLLT